MNLFYERMAKYDLPQQMKEKGIYPYFREISGKQGTEVEMDGRSVLMFGSNAYTGLTGDDRVIRAGIAAMEKYGSGCAGSRFLNGTLDLHVQLEKELAAFVGKDEALCISTGFTVNSGVISCLVGKNDFIFCDDRDHASIVDGRRLSFAKQQKYKHNDMKQLERLVRRAPKNAVKLIVVDGVFSMEGDLAPLPDIVAIKQKYQNVVIMVDEAHGLGVFGREGRGVCDHFGVTGDVDLIMGTFSKSLASIGGFIAGDSVVINYLRHNVREAGFEIGQTESPIIPLYVRDLEKTFRVTKRSFEEGVFINPVIPPACAPQDTLVRFALMATHTKEQVDRAVEALVRVFKEEQILK